MAFDPGKVLTDLQKDYVGERWIPAGGAVCAQGQFDENSEVFNHLLSSVSEIAIPQRTSEEYLVAEINGSRRCGEVRIPSMEIAAKTWAKLNINPSFAKAIFISMNWKAHGTLFGIDDTTNAVIPGNIR